MANISVHQRDNLSKFFSPYMSQEIYESTSSLIRSLAQKDPALVSHSYNVAYYAMMTACEINGSIEECYKYYLGGLLHDVGKLGIPETILFKPSKLTVEEYNTIKQHPQVGHDTLMQYKVFNEHHQILDIVLYHHERFDGTGYPMKLKGEQIPLVARILSIADSFDAMTTSRVYRKEKDLNYAVKQIYENMGSQFDPEIAIVFLKVIAREKNKSPAMQFKTLECMGNG
jgi:HD-GYP domain-containing protein (c-di-GMP phosphodiesterase class II)